MTDVTHFICTHDAAICCIVYIMGLHNDYEFCVKKIRAIYYTLTLFTNSNLRWKKPSQNLNLKEIFGIFELEIKKLEIKSFDFWSWIELFVLVLKHRKYHKRITKPFFTAELSDEITWLIESNPVCFVCIIKIKFSNR